MSPDNFTEDEHHSNDYVNESYSDINRSSVDNSEPGGYSSSVDHIRVVNNEDSEGEEKLETENRFQGLDDISEHTEKESDGPSVVKNSTEESKVFQGLSNNKDYMVENNITLTDEDNMPPIVFGYEQQKFHKEKDSFDHLNVKHVSPPERSNQTLSDSSGSYISPPASTIGIRSSMGGKSNSPPNSNTKDQDYQLENNDDIRHTPRAELTPEQSIYDRNSNSETKNHEMSPIMTVDHENSDSKTINALQDRTNNYETKCNCETSTKQYQDIMQNLMNTTEIQDSNQTSVKIPTIINNMPPQIAGTRPMDYTAENKENLEESFVEDSKDSATDQNGTRNEEISQTIHNENTPCVDTYENTYSDNEFNKRSELESEEIVDEQNRMSDRNKFTQADLPSQISSNQMNEDLYSDFKSASPDQCTTNKNSNRQPKIAQKDNLHRIKNTYVVHGKIEPRNGQLVKNGISKTRSRSNKTKATTAKTKSSVERWSVFPDTHHKKMRMSDLHNSKLRPEVINEIKKATRELERITKRATRKKQYKINKLIDQMPHIRNLAARSNSPGTHFLHKSSKKKRTQKRRYYDVKRHRMRSAETKSDASNFIKAIENSIVNFKRRSLLSKKSKSKKLSKAKSPTKVINHPEVGIKIPKKTKDKSMVINLTIKIS